MDKVRIIGKRWRVVRRLGRGGQGVVSEVVDVSGRLDSASLGAKLRAVLGDLTAHAYQQENLSQDTAVFTAIIDEIIALRYLRRGALKELLPPEDAVNAAAAQTRIETEFAVLQRVDHPALIKVLDSDIAQRWFVTEFFQEGSLANKPGLFQGQVLKALQAFRPLVEAVAKLHEAGIVHRDVKPENVFRASSGELILGDCGLAFKLDNVDRVTETIENVGSRDWMPGWAMGMRLADVKPSFDVFSLGKLLWSMISGRPRLQLWYHRKPQFDLARMFESDESMAVAQMILDRTVVEDPENCLSDAGDLLALIDWSIDALMTRFRVVGGDLLRKCLVCGTGKYLKIVDHDTQRQRNFGLEVVGQPKFRIFVCDGCGHTQLFYSMDGIRPPAWTV